MRDGFDRVMAAKRRTRPAHSMSARISITETKKKGNFYDGSADILAFVILSWLFLNGRRSHCGVGVLMTLHRCIGCKFAQWKRTTAGRLHPSGDGRCTWELKVPAIPASKAFGGLVVSPYLIGGFISRKEPIEKCPTYQPEIADAKPPACEDRSGTPAIEGRKP